MQPYFLFPGSLAFCEIAIVKMFQNQKYSGDIYRLPFNWTKLFRVQKEKSQGNEIRERIVFFYIWCQA